MKLVLDQRAHLFLYHVGQLTGDDCDELELDACLYDKIDSLFADWELEIDGKSSFVQLSFDFLKKIIDIPGNSNSGLGHRCKADLLKLVDDTWRKDPRIIMLGIEYFAISLEMTDIVKLI